MAVGLFELPLHLYFSSFKEKKLCTVHAEAIDKILYCCLAQVTLVGLVGLEVLGKEVGEGGGWGRQPALAVGWRRLCTAAGRRPGAEGKGRERAEE